MVGTPETAAKAAATKIAKQASAGRITGFPKNTKVKVNTPRERRYHGKVGIVESHNLGEIGVDFGSGSQVWFYPHQLTKHNAPA
jgi:hypothetical protein